MAQIIFIQGKCTGNGIQSQGFRQVTVNIIHDGLCAVRRGQDGFWRCAVPGFIDQYQKLQHQGCGQNIIAVVFGPIYGIF